jgi:hypothetical protein
MNVKGKVLLSAVLSIGLLCPTLQAAKAQAAVPPKVTILLDGYPLPFPAEPKSVKGYTMVPFRAISEAIGVQVQYDARTSRITATKKNESGNRRIVLELNKPTATVDGRQVKLEVAPQATGGTTLIPLSFFSRQFGAGVAWNGTTKTVSITSPKQNMYVSGYYALSSFDQRNLIPGMDSVAFGWSRIARDGHFTADGEEYKWPQSAGDITPESIVADAALGGTLPYLMVYSTDGKLELTKMLKDPALRKETVDGIIGLATEKGFKGVHLDFEGLGLSGDKQLAKTEYNTFVSELSKQTRAAGLKLSLILHPLNSVFKGYDYRTLASLADELVIMAYAYEDESGPEPLSKVDESVRLALKQVQASKLVLGISFGSENENSVNAKIGLAKRYGLKGIALWRLGLISDAEYKAMQKTISFKV